MSTNQDRTAPVELRWIEEPTQKLTRPPLDDFDVPDRTITSLILKKSKENVLVPLGLVATAACLTMGLVNLKTGNRAKQQLFMRGRVGFQAFTLAAMTLGAIITGTSRSTSETRTDS